MILPVFPPRAARGPSTSSPAVTPSSSWPTGSALQQPENHHIYDLVCGMFCYLNIPPIISQSIQVAQNGGAPEELPHAMTSECLQQDSELEGLQENGNKIEEELELDQTRTRLNKLESSLESAKNLI
ncbi:hypothetical protein PG984_009961 [Apiospora sp. TS-2023a]